MVRGIRIMLLTKFFCHNWPAIFYFNFKMLPFRQAIHLPFDFYHQIRFNDLSGKVNIRSKKVYRGMIKIGGRGSDIFTRRCSVITLRGYMEVGYGIELGTGISLVIDKDAKFILGNNVRFGAFTKVYCNKQIEMDNEIDFSWECQIFDTNFHYIKTLKDGQIYPINSPIKIGSNVWVGNRVSVMKGTIIPNNTIVASNSLCNKDYSVIGEYALLAGSPATMKKKGYKRLFENVDYDPRRTP